ncbi:integrase/recombinase, phage integrase family [Escherichia coli]|uniref:Integrase/recombinase, phage integrase family n=1 Tax=Escherichia coli TaxID=562 RepID=A0A376ZLV8_ECOLX|nr:integrase/recombinase, phage integrase family [Escherichia coli]
MSIKKLEDGRYLLDIRPNGRKGKRVRKVFDKKSVAVATERYIMANAEKREYIQGYRDRRTLNDLLELWWMYHGQHRRKAEEDRKQLRNIINELGADMQAVDLDKLKIIAWRSQKIAEGLKPSSANRYMNRLSGMFTVLKKNRSLGCRTSSKGNFYSLCISTRNGVPVTEGSGAIARYTGGRLLACCAFVFKHRGALE